jgi:glucosamine-6-phosphate deaminase
MNCIICPDSNAAIQVVVSMIARELVKKPGLVLGLATGRTMDGVYRELRWRHVEGGLDFSRCRTFNLDEYVGLRPEDPDSYHRYMRENLFRHVNLAEDHTHLPDGSAFDLEAECRDYEQRIAAAGGIDLQLLGIGVNGHIGFNEPDSCWSSRTRVVDLSPLTLEQNSSLFTSSDQVPARAVTMGMATILEARSCLLLATGAAKAEVLAAAIEGPVTTALPASALRRHPHCTVVLDEAAASRLRSRESGNRYQRVGAGADGWGYP